MKVLGIHETKANVICTTCRDGESGGKSVPHVRENRLRPHPQMSKILINYDPIEPLSEDEWRDV